MQKCSYRQVTLLIAKENVYFFEIFISVCNLYKTDEDAKLKIKEVEEMEKVESKFNKECKEDCVVHKLVTHNACVFCLACRKSPYLKDELLGKSDEEIEAIQKEVKEELGEC